MRVELYFTGGTPRLFGHKMLRFKAVHRSVDSARKEVAEIKKRLDHDQDGDTLMKSHTPMVSISDAPIEFINSGGYAITWLGREVIPVHA